MTTEIKTERRWLRSVIAASAEPLPNFPWMRAERRRPAALQSEDAKPASQAPQRRPALFTRPGPIAAR